MRPRVVPRVEGDDDLALYPTEMPPPAAEPFPKPSAVPRPRPAKRVDASWIVPVMIAMLTAVATFALVRWRVAPARAATPRVATLTVDTRPPAADVSIDGQPRGTTPLTLSVTPGAHSLTLRKNDAERV